MTEIVKKRPMREEVDWEKLDKTKFLVMGLGVFSGLTSLLYPMSVIKTRQMATDSVSGGLKGAQQTVATIWKTDGIGGFYRGFGTVVFGTIPARMMYLTVLESTKSVVHAALAPTDVSETTAAAVANFLGGAVGSTATQAVAVPIDVVSQRQMVHGADVSSSRSATTTSGSSTTAPGSSPPTSGSSTVTNSSNATTSTGTAGKPSPTPHATNIHAPSSVGGSSSASPSSSHRPTTTATTSHASHTLQPTAYQSTTTTPSSTSNTASYTSSSSHPAPNASHASTSSQSAPHSRPNGLSIARSIVRAEGVRGLYRGFGASVATFVPSSAVWWGAYGAYQKLIYASWYPQEHDPHVHVHGEPHISHAEHSTTSVIAVQTASAVLAGMTSSLLTNPLDLVKTRVQVARRQDAASISPVALLKDIVKTNGVAGLWRGALPRMASSAIWGTCMVSAYEFLKRSCQMPESVDVE